MTNQSNLPKPRRGLPADALIEALRRRFQDVLDRRRQASCGYPMSDTLMSAFALFATKEPSLLSFEDHQRELQRGRELKQWLFDNPYYLVAIDGSGYFCSDHVKYDHCVGRRINGKGQYYHQVVAAVLVHRITKQVIPLAVEPILRSDGNTKIDCERNATRRLLAILR